MAHGNSSSEHFFIQGGLQNKVASKKPSTYIFDSNGDTQLVLTTNIDQAFVWEAERIATRISYFDPYVVRDTADPFSLFPGMTYSRPGLSDAEATDPRPAGAGKNIDSLSLQDSNYGERSANLPGQVEIRMLVSGKHLVLASSYFEKMFSGPFIEGKADHHSGLRQVIASDWDPKAFNIVLTAIHGYHREIPRSLDLEMLAKLAMIVDYYECHEIIELNAEIWIGNLKSKVPTVYGRDCILCLFVSWVFSQPEMFQTMAQLALRHSGKEIEAGDIPIPSSILGQINIARLNYLDKISTATYDLLDRLQGEELECSYECSAMLLGVLTKELKRYGVLSRRYPQSFYRFSIEGLKNMIKSYKIPEWHDTGYGARYGSGHSCTIQQKLSLALEKAEDELCIFSLQDFQFAKHHTQPLQNVWAFKFECKT
ncbi:unnamed protein product [Fusarium venenatum]|uniref:BTB domain-containing protein n=1 Tax=Fusarium venenatum TaxID=56646 RepID=A0A2L2SRS8_9HYPO|nr:uncharacterized protein FVRRES_13705 [Fusarium venenatum]CEI41710.1 unnamed protein product [Fusarium venenatum]